MKEIEKARIEASLVGLFRALADVNGYGENLKTTKYKTKKLREIAMKFSKETNIVINTFLEDMDLSEGDYRIFESNLQNMVDFNKEYIVPLSFVEQKKVSDFIQKMREDYDREGIDFSKKETPKDPSGFNETKVITISKEKLAEIKGDLKMESEEDHKKYKQKCFAQANSIAGKEWEYKTHILGSNKSLRVVFTKKIDNEKQ